MNTIILILLVIIAVSLIILIVKTFTVKDMGLNQELIDMKNQLFEFKTKQLEMQNLSLRSQQELFAQTQKNMNDQLGSITNSVNTVLPKTQANINSQLSNTGVVINEIHKKLGSLEETARNIQAIGKDISSLQTILQAPKLRGNLGEYLLEELLKQIFPSKNYEIQYRFRNGTLVDAVIKLGEGIIPVDSKFPLESFQRMISSEKEEEKNRFKKEFIRGLKARIDEIAVKYINQDEGTFDFAMMYIPAENVFYEIIINDTLTNRDYEIFNYAIERHVIPVSPNSFYAYLMAIVYGLKGFKIEQQARMIMGELSRVQDTFSVFYRDFNLVGKHIDNASAKYRECLRRAEKFNDKVSQITGIKTDLLDIEGGPQIGED